MAKRKVQKEVKVTEAVKKTPFQSLVPYLYLGVVLVVSYLTYFRNYTEPKNLFWDENYHIASAEKYLEGIFFMEMHPPLGKLLIAAGEAIFKPNKDLDLSTFTTTDYIKDVPPGYSFKGVRFFSTLFGFLAAGIFFFALYLLLGNPHLALFFTSLYLFDNALIVQSRAAMLEGPQLFFILLGICFGVFLIKRAREPNLRELFFLGITLGLAISIKANSGILLLFFPILFFRHAFVFSKTPALIVKRFFLWSVVSGVGILLPIVLIWYAHFSISKTVLNDKYYNVSPKYQAVLNGEKVFGPADLSFMLRDAYKYFFNYQKGVPRLKGDVPDENGSHPIFWPLGKYSISYRWDKTDQGKVQYLRLQCNPIGWAIGGIAVILSIILVGAHYLYGLEPRNKQLFLSIEIFLGLYLAYMGTMFGIERVMYLYHYFIPLLFSFFLSALIFQYLMEECFKRHSKVLYAGLFVFSLNIFSAYVFFSPFTYHQPLSTQEFLQRSWLDIWRLEPVF